MPKKYHKILLIDDDKVINFVNKKMILLLKLADEVISQESGESALSYLKEAIANRAVLPEIIFLDIQMPIMNGFQFLAAFEELAKEYEPLKASSIIIFLTSSIDPTDKAKATSSPYVKRFLNKPLTKEMFDTIDLGGSNSISL